MDGKQIARSLAAMVIKVAVTVLVIVLIYRLAVTAYTFGFRVFAEKPMTEGEGITVTIVVSEEDDVRSLGQKLYERGLIRDTNLFYFQELLSNYHDQMQPGRHQLNTSMTVEEMLGVLASEPDPEPTGLPGSDTIQSGPGVDALDDQNADGADVPVYDGDISLPDGE